MEKESKLGVIQEVGDLGLGFEIITEQEFEKLNIEKKDNSKEDK